MHDACTSVASRIDGFGSVVRSFRRAHVRIERCESKAIRASARRVRDEITYACGVCLHARGGASTTARYPCAPRRPLSMHRSLSLYDPTAPFIFMFVQFFLFLFICTNSHVGFPSPNHLVVTLVALRSHIDESRLAVRDSQPRGEGRAIHSFHSSGTVVRFFCFHATQPPPFRLFFSRRGAVFVKRCHHSRACFGDASGRIRTTPNPTRHRCRRASFQKERRAATRAREPHPRERLTNFHACFYSHGVARLGVFAFTSRSATR